MARNKRMYDIIPMRNALANPISQNRETDAYSHNSETGKFIFHL